jgi:hypothetical protein
MLMSGIDDFTVMETVGHLTKRMLERYAHPPAARKLMALETFDQALAGHTVATLETSPKHHPAAAHVAHRGNKSGLVVDGRRLELPTSALRTRRSPN